MKRLTILLLVSACGFSPMYQKKTTAGLTTHYSMLVKPINGKRGIDLRQQLRENLSPTGDPQNPEYRLEVTLHEPRVDLRGLRQDATATWGTVIAKAQYRIVSTKDEKEILKSQETAFASYQVLTSVYSSMTATEDSYDRATETLGNQILAHVQAFMNKRKKK